jgi:phage baseplate assembly protein W
MSPRWSSWRFRVPPYDAPEGEPVGLVLDPAGGIDTVADDEAIRQSLMLLISTRPGERVMRPEYGCDLARLVFSPNDDTTAGLAIHFVRQAVERWEPRVEVLRVDAGRVEGPSVEAGRVGASRGDGPGVDADPRDPDLATRIEIVLDYRVRATMRSDSVVVGVDLQEGL